MATATSLAGRRPYIDWLRGVAVLIMIAWHSIDSWSVLEGRNSLGFGVVVFLAGWAAPLFLFLAGVSLPLAGASRLAKGIDRRDVCWSLQKRAWQVFIIAHLFRFQSFLLNVNGSWNTILKPDILNVLGLGLVATAICWGRVRSTRDAVLWLLVPALLIVAVVTPLSRHWWWPTLLHPRFEAYIRPVSNSGVFSLFPTTAYVFAGAFVGFLIGGHAPADVRFHRKLGLAGAGLLVLGLAVAFIPSPFGVTKGDAFSLFVWRVGAMSLALACCWGSLRHRSPTAWSPIVVLGQASLLVYWVHVELVYGVFSYPIRHALTLPSAVAAYLLLTLAMFGCAELWLRRPKAGPIVPAHMAAP